MTRCPSCTGHGQAFQDEWPVHIPCGECAGTGLGEVAEAARDIYDALFRDEIRDRVSTRRRRETIARHVASAVGARRGREMSEATVIGGRCNRCNLFHGPGERCHQGGTTRPVVTEAEIAAAVDRMRRADHEGWAEFNVDIITAYERTLGLLRGLLPAVDCPWEQDGTCTPENCMKEEARALLAGLDA